MRLPVSLEGYYFGEYLPHPEEKSFYYNVKKESESIELVLELVFMVSKYNSFVSHRMYIKALTDKIQISLFYSKDSYFLI